MGRAVSSAESRPLADHDARWGVLQCMQMLVEEALMLELSETAAALERALQVGHCESGFHRPVHGRVGH